MFRAFTISRRNWVEYTPGRRWCVPIRVLAEVHAVGEVRKARLDPEDGIWYVSTDL